MIITGNKDDLKESLVTWKEILEWYGMSINKNKIKVTAPYKENCKLNTQIERRQHR